MSSFRIAPFALKTISFLMLTSLAAAQYEPVERQIGQPVSAPDDPKAAVAWYRVAAQRNDPEAMNQLGIRLRLGQGVAWNEAEAMRWFKRAAELGHPGAQTELGWGYMKGLGGGVQDYHAAAFWFDRAARQGSGVAQINLGVLYQNGWGVSQDRERARSLYLQAARSPYPQIASMGRSYATALPRAPRPRPAAFSKDSDALIAGVAVVVGVAVLAELLSGPSSHGSSSSVSSGGAPNQDQSTAILRDSIARDEASRQAGADQRQAEKDSFYHVQRCGFNGRSDCF